MSVSLIWRMLRKDLEMGPRSPIFLYAIVFPLVATLLIRMVFGSLFEPSPRLGVVDEGRSQIAAAVRQIEGIELRFPESAARLKEMVSANDLDAGLILQADFDQAVRDGRRPVLQLFVGGESLASNRVILAVTTIDLIRGVAGVPTPVAVDVVTIGESEAVPLTLRLLPLLVMFAVLIAGLFLSAAGLVQEKEARTLEALLVTPTQVVDVIVGKGLLGFLLAMAAGVATLALNGVLGASAGALVLVLALGALMAVELGLIFGSLAKDTHTLFTAIKSANALLIAPVFFFIWPDLPQWIPRIFPTYYFIEPIFEMAVKDAPLADVAGDLAIGLAICAALLPFVYVTGRRMQVKVATA